MLLYGGDPRAVISLQFETQILVGQSQLNDQWDWNVNFIFPEIFLAIHVSSVDPIVVPPPHDGGPQRLIYGSVNRRILLVGPIN